LENYLHHKTCNAPGMLALSQQTPRHPPTERPMAKKRTGPGRPSRYRVDYNALLIDYMAEGLSFEAFAGHIGVTRRTLYNWLEQYESFQEARELGLAKCRDWWERLGLKIAEGVGNERVVVKELTRETPDGKVTETVYGPATPNGSTWFANMKNRFFEDCKDRHEIDVGVKFDKASDTERAKLLAEAVEALSPTEQSLVLDLIKGADGVHRPTEALPLPVQN